MKIFIFTFLYLYSIFNLLPIFDLDVSFYFFYFFFIFFFFLNYLIFSKFQNTTIKLDLLINFVNLFLRNSKTFFLYVIILFKKIVYFIFFKFFKVFKTLLFFVKDYSSSFFLIWRPLFKKLSYFGFFRTNRNKWLK